MGLYVSLNLTPTIAADQWDGFWCDSLRLLQKFPLRLVRAAMRKTPFGNRKIWTDKLTASDKHGEYWEIAGDAESLIFGGPVRLYRNLEYYQQKWKRLKQDNPPPNDDPLFCVFQDFAEEKGNVPLSGVQIFNEKTQGYPYHHAVVAVVTLAEHCFPLHSFAWGDLCPDACHLGREWLSSLYDEEILSPICLDAARLWNRIEGVCGDIPTTMNRFEERFLGTTVQRIHRMLAESRETTMQKLAGDLLQYDTVTLGFRELAKSFLEATDDLDLFLDLIDLRNTLASDKKTRKKKRPVINLEDVLKMLAKGFVTYSQWQGEEIRTLRRWIEMKGNVVHAINTALLNAILPDFFDYYCPEKDLLETFTRREPAKQKKFSKVLQVALQENLEAEEMIKDFVQTLQGKAEAKARDSETADEDDEDTDNRFVQFMKDGASIQSELSEPLSEKNVAKLGRYIGFYVDQMQQIISDMEEGGCLTDPTGNSQRKLLLAIIQQNGGRLLEEAILAIEQTDDMESLKLFASVSPFLFAEQFRSLGSVMFSEGFEVVYPVLWHVLNKPVWWQIFQEHRNDGLNEG